MGLVAGLLTDVTTDRSPVEAAVIPIDSHYFYTGNTETWVAPSAGVIEIYAFGGGGAGSIGGGTGDNAARVNSWWTVAKNDQLQVRAGGGGSDGSTGGNGGTADVAIGGSSASYAPANSNGNGGGGAGFGGGGGGALGAGAGGGGYAGGGGGSRAIITDPAQSLKGSGGGGGSSFAATDQKPTGKPDPTFVTATSPGYGAGGDDTGGNFEGYSGLVVITFTANPPTPPTPPNPPVKTPGKPGTFKVDKKTTAKKRNFTWRASANATRATTYTLEIRAKGKKKVLIRKTIKANAKRKVTITRTTLINKSRKFQKRAKTVKLRASIYAKTGSKKSTTASKNFNVRR